MSKKTLGMLIYANPDHYPPTLNAIHLLSHYFDIVLIGRNQDPPFWKYPANVKVYRLGQYSSVREREQKSTGAKFHEYINFICQASRLLKDVSLIYAYDTFGYTTAYLCHFIQRLSIPLIYHNHDLSYQLSSLSSLSGWVQRGERRWVHKANLVVFPSEERALFFKRLTNVNVPLVIVPNFPRKSYIKEHHNFKNCILERFEKKQILLQGTISVKNSLLELVDGLTFLDNSITLKLIGPIQEEEKSLMKDCIDSKKVAERVKYFSPVPYNDLFSHTWRSSLGVCLYKKIDVNHQTMGTASNKIYEYAACGLPVIVSDQPNYRKHLAHETWVRFANPDDSRSIAFAVQDILKDFKKYQAMCLAARQAFEEKYNYESAFFPLLEKINNLLDCSDFS